MTKVNDSLEVGRNGGEDWFLEDEGGMACFIPGYVQLDTFMYHTCHTGLLLKIKALAVGSQWPITMTLLPTKDPAQCFSMPRLIFYNPKLFLPNIISFHAA